MRKTLIAALGATVAALAAQGADTEPVTPAITEAIIKAHFDLDKVYSTEQPQPWEGYGRYPLTVTEEGDTVILGSDMGQFYTYISIGDTTVFQHPTEIVDSLDTAHGAVIMSDRGRTRRFRIADPGFVDSVKAFAAPLEGFRRVGYTYAYDQISDPGSFAREKKTIYLDVPADSAEFAMYLKTLNPAADSLEGYYRNLFNDDVEETYQDIRMNMPIDPDTYFYPMEAFNTMKLDEAYSRSGEYITWREIIRKTYPAGGGYNAYDIYRTIHLPSGKVLKAEDLINDMDAEAVKKAYVDAIYKAMLKNGYFGSEPIPDEMRARVIDVVSEKEGAVIEDVILPENMATVPGYIVMDVPLDEIFDFGELMDIYVFVPVAEIEKYLTPLALKIVR